MQTFMPRKFRVAEKNEISVTTVNVVSTFLLALLILPKLRESAREAGVILTVSITGALHIGSRNFRRGVTRKEFLQHLQTRRNQTWMTSIHCVIS